MYSYNNNKKPLFRGFFCFKEACVVVFIFTSLTFFSQERLIKKSTFQSKEIEIITDGLDDVIIENSLSNQIEVILLDENPNTHTVFLEEQSGVLKINFKLNFNVFKEPVFRKYITKRLQRASAIIKIPNKKIVNIFGKSIDVTSKSYNGDLKIYIDTGNVKLNEVKGNTSIKLFIGNVYAQLKKNSSANVKTNNGVITINGEVNSSPFFKKKKNLSYNFIVNSIKANVAIEGL